MPTKLMLHFSRDSKDVYVDSQAPVGCLEANVTVSNSSEVLALLAKVAEGFKVHVSEGFIASQLGFEVGNASPRRGYPKVSKSAKKTAVKAGGRRKRRPAEVVAAEKAEKAMYLQAKKNIGLAGVKGHLKPPDQKKLDAELAKLKKRAGR